MGKIKSFYKVSIIISSICLLLVGIIFILSLKDSEEIVLRGNEELFLEVNTEYKEDGFYIKGNKGNKRYDVLVTNNIDNKHIGNYNIYYSIKGKDVSAVRTIKVVDSTPPVITLKGSKVAVVCPNYSYEEEGFIVSDNYDSLSLEDVKIEVENNYIKYSIYDSSNNKGYVTRNIIYSTSSNPVIEVDNRAVVYVNDKFTDKYKAYDSCGNDLTNKVIVKGSVDVKKEGVYALTYMVTDDYGKTSVMEKEVIVKKKEKDYKRIYLTFDDGPSSDVTNKILDLLGKYNIKATFFLIGHNNTDDIIKRIYNEGHAIGLHTYSHSYKNVYKSEEAFFNDLDKISNKVYDITGYKSYIIRFPGGSSNTVSRNYNKGIMTRLTKEVESKGYYYFDWNVDSGDTLTQDSDKICKNVTKSLNKGANIVLMHDYKGHQGTYDALPCIIEYAFKNGYTFDKIGKDTKSIHHNIQN